MAKMYRKNKWLFCENMFCLEPQTKFLLCCLVDAKNSW